MTFIMIYITNPNEDDAKKVVKHLLDKKLIACGNLIPIKSIYWWKEKIQDETEVVAIVKTRKENWEKVKAEVKKIHPYDIPCIIKIGAEANSEYEKWLSEETDK